MLRGQPQAKAKARACTLVVNPTKISRQNGSDTLAVIGPSRGGTSLIAYALFNAGIFIGKRVGTLNYEDLDIRHALNDDAQMLGIIAARNADHSRWGFKLPAATFRAPWLALNLRNPVFIVAMRNPMRVADTIRRRDPTALPDIYAEIEHGMRFMNAALAAIKQSSAPAIFVDTDLSALRPDLFLDEMAAILRLDYLERQTIEDAILSGDYQFSKPQEGVSFVG